MDLIYRAIYSQRWYVNYKQPPDLSLGIRHGQACKTCLYDCWTTHEISKLDCYGQRIVVRILRCEVCSQRGLNSYMDEPEKFCKAVY